MLPSREKVKAKVWNDDGEVNYGEVENYSIEKFRMKGEHFSHDHPLKKRCEDKEEEADDKVCSICGVPIVCSPSYTCTIGCKFFLHQECALKMPLHLIHFSHSIPAFLDQHVLHLLRKESWAYECEDCDFRIHPLLALPTIEIKTKHKTHSSHPLLLIPKHVSCECDVCGEKQEGFFFCCSQGCNFFIHSACAVLPNIIMLPTYTRSFIFTYPLPPSLSRQKCTMCRKPLIVHNGVYFSPGTFNYAHIACAIAKFESLGAETRLEFVQLPDNDELDRFRSLMIRRYAKTLRKSSGQKNIDEDEDVLTIEKYHDHPLIHVTISEKKTCCDLCTKPINAASPFYRCSLEKDCSFSSHSICVDILPVVKFLALFGEDDVLRPKFWKDPSSVWFKSIYHCLFCHGPCNGICFQHRDDDDEYKPGTSEDDEYDYQNIPQMIDLECMVAPHIISHASHPHHLLYRTITFFDITSEHPLTCCPKNTFYCDVYKCIVCEFCVHISCAGLPKSVVYESYHHHNLKLVFPQINNDVGGLCEVCEREIDLNYWLYGCGECDQWFHINCIPSVGYLSKVKFGGTLTHSHCHFDDHPLALTRMLTLPSQRCGCCHLIIQGLVDEMAFSCSLCYYWIHFSCASPQDSSILIFSNFDEQKYITAFRKEVYRRFI